MKSTISLKIDIFQKITISGFWFDRVILMDISRPGEAVTFADFKTDLHNFMVIRWVRSALRADRLSPPNEIASIISSRRMW
jgi:hypothetical protein